LYRYLPETGKKMNADVRWVSRNVGLYSIELSAREIIDQSK